MHSEPFRRSRGSDPYSGAMRSAVPDLNGAAPDPDDCGVSNDLYRWIMEFKDPDEPSPPPGPDGGKGARFTCPHCALTLLAECLPASGPCPACHGQLDIRVSTPGSRAGIAGRLPWLLCLFLVILIVLGCLLIGRRVGLGALDVESYDPSIDSRFAAWPWSLAINPSCRVPADALSGIGWDELGRSHALVDPSHIAITHNTPPEKLSFRDASGRIWKRKVTTTHTLAYDRDGLPWVRLCRLDQPLPASVRHLPVLELSGHRHLDLPLYLVGRHGRIGSENEGAVRIFHRPSPAGERLRSVGWLCTVRTRQHSGGANLRTGDSGTPLIARIGSQWCLVGLACAMRAVPHPDETVETIQIHALLSPQLHEMKQAGARPEVLTWPEPDSLSLAIPERRRDPHARGTHDTDRISMIHRKFPPDAAE